MSMKPEEQAEYAEIICQSFTDNEIEHLENFAHWCWDKIDRGVPFRVTTDDLILDRLKEYTEDSPCVRTMTGKCINPHHDHKGVM